MAGSGQFSTFISRANRQVHLCEQMFAVAKITENPKLLLKVLEHAKNAVDAASAGISITFDGEIHDTTVAFKIIGSEVPSAKEMKQIYAELEATISQYMNSTTIFTKNGKIFLAKDNFDTMRSLGVADVERFLITVKQFVYEAGRAAILQTAR